MSADDKIIEALLGEFRLDDNASTADQEALQALRRTIDNPTQVLARYLRESLFIHPVVRKHLANALDAGTVYGTRLVMQGGGGNLDNTKARAARRRWLEIGRWVEERRASGIGREDALEEAEMRFHCDYETCRKASSYAVQFKRYCQKNEETPLFTESPEYQKYGIAWMEETFHSEHIKSQRVKKKREPRSGYRF